MKDTYGRVQKLIKDVEPNAVLYDAEREIIAMQFILSSSTNLHFFLHMWRWTSPRSVEFVQREYILSSIGHGH